MSEYSQYTRWGILLLALLVRHVKLDVGWNNFMFQGQHSLDQTCETRRPFAVADVGFHGPNEHAVLPENVAHRCSLDGVTDCGSRAVTLM